MSIILSFLSFLLYSYFPSFFIFFSFFFLFPYSFFFPHIFSIFFEGTSYPFASCLRLHKSGPTNLLPFVPLLYTSVVWHTAIDARCTRLRPASPTAARPLLAPIAPAASPLVPAGRPSSHPPPARPHHAHRPRPPAQGPYP